MWFLVPDANGGPFPLPRRYLTGQPERRDQVTRNGCMTHRETWPDGVIIERVPSADMGNTPQNDRSGVAFPPMLTLINRAELVDETNGRRCGPFLPYENAPIPDDAT